LNLIKARIIISGFILVLFVFLFTGTEKISVFLSEFLPPFQFIPALVRSIIQPEALFIAGLFFIVLVTLIFGRVYCSFLCPLGTIQDLLIWGSKRIGLKSRHSFSRPYNGLRYAILALVVAATFIGILSPAGLLDPYSLTGRIFTYFLQPLIIQIYNLGILILKPFDIYLYPKQTAFIPLLASGVTAVFALLILYLCARHGRLYCNTICPAGALLGLISRVSFFQFILNKKACSECSQCENICKAQCIDLQNAAVDMSRCVGCFNCLHSCSRATIHYQPRQNLKRAKTWSPERRGFVIGGIAAAAGLVALNANMGRMPGIRPAQAAPPVTPPGSLNTMHFTQACTACSLCVSVCPTQVLTPTLMDFGIAGLMQPKMNYEKSYCDYECKVCSDVCPTGAITPLSLDEKKLTQIGEAKLLEDICIVYVNHNNCGACGEVCPTHAIRFVDKENILYPEIDKQYCIGCGACQLACPTKPRSIVVHARPIHKKAEKYILPEKTVDPNASGDPSFPF
jgi:ferredoxin